MTLGPRARIVLWLVHASAVAVLLLTSVAYLHRPLRFDEIDLAAEARDGVLVHGTPVIPAAESHRQLVGADARYGAVYGLWHPPLYVYLLALAAMLGPADAWLRAVGLLCLTGSFAVIWRVSRASLGPSAPREVVALPLAFAAFSPIVAQGSLFVDIDNTVLATLMLLFLWQFTRPGDRLRRPRLAGLTACLVLMLCAKLTTFPMVWLACAVYAAGGERPGRNLLALSLIGVVAVGIVAALYMSYCAIFHLPIGWMFDVGSGGRRDLFATAKSAAGIWRSAQWNLVWLSPVLASLLAVLTVERVRSYARDRRVTPPDGWLILSIGLYVAYIGFGGMLGKYTMPAALMAAAAIGVRVARGWPTWQIPSWSVIALGACMLAVPALIQPLAISRAAPATSAMPILRDARIQSVFVLVAGVWWLAWVWLRSGRSRGVDDRLSLAGMSFALSLAVIAPIQTARVVSSPSDNGPLRAGPERGVVELIAVLRRDLPAGQIVIATKDIGYNIGRDYFDLTTLAQLDRDMIVSTAGRPDVWAIADSTVYPIVDGAMRSRLHVSRVQNVGTDRIYVLSH